MCRVEVEDHVDNEAGRQQLLKAPGNPFRSCIEADPVKAKGKKPAPEPTSPSKKKLCARVALDHTTGVPENPGESALDPTHRNDPKSEESCVSTLLPFVLNQKLVIELRPLGLGHGRPIFGNQRRPKAQIKNHKTVLGLPIRGLAYKYSVDRL